MSEKHLGMTMSVARSIKTFIRNSYISQFVFLEATLKLSDVLLEYSRNHLAQYITSQTDVFSSLMCGKLILMKI